MGIKLKNPPIEEVVCEFKFKDSSEDLTIYGDFHNKIGKTFVKKRPKSYQEVTFKKSNGKIEQKLQEFKLQQFFSEDEKTLIQVGPNILTVNRLKPYQTWEELLPVIEKAFNCYIEITHLKEIGRIGLKYINIISFKEEEIDIDDQRHL